MWRILLVDNDAEFLETLAELLSLEGYQILPASSPDEAERLLSEEYVHLAILDVRLTDDDDPKDTSGIALARRKACTSIPKIIITDYRDVEYVRAAMGPGPDGRPAAVHFVFKDDGPPALVKAIEEVLAQRLRINRGLDIHGPLPAAMFMAQLAGQVDPYIPLDKLAGRGAEMDDLFRKLFYNFAQLTLGRPLLQRENRLFLPALAYPAAGVPRQFIVHCGRSGAVHKEEELYHQFVPSPPGPGLPQHELAAEVTHYTASAYTLIPLELEEVQPWATCYGQRPPEAAQAAVDRLFEEPLAALHEHGRSMETIPYAGAWQSWLEPRGERFSLEHLRNCLGWIAQASLSSGLGRVDIAPALLTLHLSCGPDSTYPNPLPLLFGAAPPLAGFPVLMGHIHGRLDGQTILLDRGGRVGVIDFAWTGSGPLARDLATLENGVRFDLLGLADLPAWLDLEDHLAAAAEAPQEPPSPEVQKAVLTIVAIRRHAARLLGEDPRPYRVALLCECLERIARFDPERRYGKGELRPLLHALFLAGYIGEALTGLVARLSRLPREAATSIWIDEERHEVWVEGQQVRLSPQEHKVLSYLLRHAGSLCRRQRIVEEALREDFEAYRDGERMNSLVSRLRQKIEAVSSRPYIETEREEGYILDLPANSG